MSSALSDETKRSLQHEMVERLAARSDLERKSLHQDVKFSQELLSSTLYGRNRLQILNMANGGENNLAKDQSPPGLPLNEKQICSSFQGPEPSTAIRSFPPEVQLCMSSIPRAGYGVCSKRYIPACTWIGPYEGKRVRPEDVRSNMSTSYMWEIYNNGKLVHYIDASDENTSSWMRFIRCARFKEEQNLFAFQYCGNVYYRAFRDIPMGEELLVWYDEKYPQHMGIPVGLQDIPYVPRPAFCPEQDIHNNTMLLATTQAVTQKHSFLPTFGSPLTNPSYQVSTDIGAVGKKVPPQGPYNTQVPTPPPTPTEMHGFPPPLTNHSAQLQTRRMSADSVTSDQQPSPSGSDDQLIDVEANDRTDVRDVGSPSGIQRFSPVEEMNSWKCKQCQKTFTQRVLLQIHVCQCQPDRPYQCGRCSLSFANPSDLRAHVVSHVNEKPFKCGFCARSFAGATTLNNHIRTHTGQKPFNCEQCGKTFCQASMLARHQRTPGECTNAVSTATNLK